MVNQNGPIESNVPSSLPRGHGNRDRGGRPDLVVPKTNLTVAGQRRTCLVDRFTGFAFCTFPSGGSGTSIGIFYDLKGALPCEGNSNTAF